MLVGLLRLRRRGGGWFDLGHLLWKQVRWQCILWIVVITLALTRFSIREGVLWLSLATVTELIPVVRPETSLLWPRQSPFYVAGVHVFRSEWYVAFLGSNENSCVDFHCQLQLR